MKKTTNIGKRNTTTWTPDLRKTPDSSHSLPFGRLEPELLIISEVTLLANEFIYFLYKILMSKKRKIFFGRVGSEQSQPAAREASVENPFFGINI